MTAPSFLSELGHIDEPRVAHEYADVLTQVASEHRPVVVRRNGVDLAAVIPLVRLSQNSRLSMFNGAKQLRCFQ